MVHPKTLITFAAITAFPAVIIFNSANFNQSKNGTIIKIETKADGFFQTAASGIWTLGKFNEPDNVQIKSGQSATISYTISALKTPNPTGGQKGVFGDVCVNNVGKQTTEGLKITNQVQYRDKGFYKDIAGATLTQIPEAVKANSTSCIPFKIEFTPPEKAKLRLKTTATISNPNKKSEHEFTRKDTDGFSIPLTSIETPQEVTISDSLECPANYTCTPSEVGPWKITEPTNISYTVQIKNETADCSIPVSLTNVATLEDNASGTILNSGESAAINSPPC